MNPIAHDLNQIIEKGNSHLMEMLSDVGKNLFFPKGILSRIPDLCPLFWDSELKKGLERRLVYQKPFSGG